ncbi:MULTISPECIES: DNA internalization-related competence protein ComEC/Rec2 [unclassified Streptococcus]|uniref:DNA internalization-related competence protein ComEC/Rec2 n=1 Tax=unclassified Streptococcus TaxID=2608887 RepID=UPI001071AF15|nr:MULTISPECIES: DNA internalization-related competence protein ComEC/Rec2 [unclassified Streptococcus]MBF0786756.1 DNA internalization-related competence protein ComEC/Rec2 [Streptococcus sp. 19428wC2_LYSM12]MCQ9210993.1 DNA internalization-related competence protein ComEC/Rec2 [Streptococcus sp. B01]MCQ9214266.1 DNA internalization-related competence protein ComEC/Rec2 [Streptococcus sp. O1]TFV06300.1 DNA internalization-related competence protein ComEC/Rec2 [Streptococcus sp. LYSM12]
MSQLIKGLPLTPIHLAVLLLALYFVMHHLSFLSMVILVAMLLLLYFQQGKMIVYKVLPILACFFLLFGLQRMKVAMDAASTLTEISYLDVKPDTIHINGDSLSFRARSSGYRYMVFYQLKSQREQVYFKSLSHLVRLEVEATVSVPESQRNFNGFDYQDYLGTQEIYRTVKISQIKKIAQQTSWNPLDWLSLLRRKLLVYIKEHFPNPMRHYMTGLLLGDLDKEFEQMSDLYSSLGIIHLFALSGMQVGFFVDRFRSFFLRFGIRKEIVDWLQLPFAFIYASLTGFSVSVNRSLLQRILSNMGMSKLDNIACTIILSFLIMPHFLLTVGGVLSFAYAFLLAVFDFEDLAAYKRVAVESLAISLAMFPLLIYYFYSFQPLSILLTFLFSFLFDLVLLPGLSLVFLLSPLMKLTQVNALFVWLEACIRWIVDLDLKPLIFGKPTVVLLLILLLILLSLYDLYRNWKWCWGLISLLALLVFIVKYPLENEVTVVDVGQGDSIFLRDIRGRTVLIDVGGRVNVATKEVWQQGTNQANAKRTLLPYLRSRGVSRIDYLILTHAHTDHMGDLLEVVREMAIGRIYISEGSASSQKLAEILQSVKVRPHLVKVGDTIPIGDGFLHVLYPYQKGDGGNDDSVVLYGEFLQTRFLFTGDLEDSELELMKQYPQLSVDVLKVGHHGSKGSSHPEFLAAISPRIALISVGKNNRYKHPHQETLTRFQERQIQVFRTDEQGAIRFRGWRKWKIETVR